MNEQEEKKMMSALHKEKVEPHFDALLSQAGFVPKRKNPWPYLIPALAASLALGVAIPVTWSITKKATNDAFFQSATAGAGESQDVQKKLSETAKFHYQTAIGNLFDSGVIYADLYYAFNALDDNFVVIQLHRALASSFSINEGAELRCYSDSGLTSVHSVVSSFVWDFQFTTYSSVNVAISHSFDLKPYYDSVMAAA
jgi:hypothetical protein